MRMSFMLSILVTCFSITTFAESNKFSIYCNFIKGASEEKWTPTKARLDVTDSSAHWDANTDHIDLGLNPDPMYNVNDATFTNQNYVIQFPKYMLTARPGTDLIILRQERDFEASYKCFRN